MGGHPLKGKSREKTPLHSKKKASKITLTHTLFFPWLLYAGPVQSLFSPLYPHPLLLSHSVILLMHCRCAPVTHRDQGRTIINLEHFGRRCCGTVGKRLCLWSLWKRCCKIKNIIEIEIHVEIFQYVFHKLHSLFSTIPQHRSSGI